MKLEVLHCVHVPHSKCGLGAIFRPSEVAPTSGHPLQINVTTNLSGKHFF